MSRHQIKSHIHSRVRRAIASCLILAAATSLVQSQAYQQEKYDSKSHLFRSQVPTLGGAALWTSPAISQRVAPSSGRADLLERRAGNTYSYGGGHASTTIGGKRGTQVAISVERVKNPDDEPAGYGKKKRKFPITWLRNQYPFNSYYKKKSAYQEKPANKYGDPMSGQYSSDSYEVLDPNPSTWVKIPDRPTASIKFSKQGGAPSLLEPAPEPALPLPVPGSLQMQMSPAMMHGAALPPMRHMPVAGPYLGVGQLVHQPPRPPMLAPGGGGGGMMTSESQQDYSSQQQQQQPAQEPQSGFGGISLSFGNGRSISFGGGQGLTIGGRAGAISIGGKNGGGAAGPDNTPAASGYSETKGGNGGAPSGYGGAGGAYGGGGGGGYNSAGGYGDGYVNKHPTMSVDVPRKGKTIVHANLDMAPIKLRLHSSPRVKITTGSRDPLEKPSDEELSENEEDIFEPPEPFPKKNATATANETMSDGANAMGSVNGTNGMNETSVVSPMQISQQNGFYPPGYNQQQVPYNQLQPQSFGQFQQQVPFDDHPAANQGAYNGQRQFNQQQQQQQQQDYHRQANNHYRHNQQQQPHHPNQNQHPYQVPFDEPPGNFPVQQAQVQHQFRPNDAPPQQHFHADAKYPPQRPLPPQQQQQPLQMPPQQQQQMVENLNDDRPAVNQWRAARQQMNQFVPKQQDFSGDNNLRLYNGEQPRPQQPPPPPPVQQQPMGEPNQAPMMMMPQQQQQPPQNLQSLDKDTVDFAASSNQEKYAKSAQGARQQQHVPVQHSQFGPSTAYQIVGGRGEVTDVKVPQFARQQQVPSTKAQSAVRTEAPKGQQQAQVQAQESRYAPSSYGRQTNADYGDQNTRTYTFGNGGISTSYGSSSSYSSSSHDSHAPSCTTTDCFDQRNYAAKVEKFDPDAHDKRERSKVVLFLKPRISIHMANSSTTTKRPKNRQRLIHVITDPIIMNSTNATHHDEEFIDPDLKRPMDVYNYGYGYGNGYTKGYSTKPSSSTTTKKPKTTTTTTTTTAAPTEPESTTSSTSSSSETEGTTTTTASSATSESTGDSSSTTDTSATTTTAATTTTESPGDSSSSQPTSETPTTTTTVAPAEIEASSVASEAGSSESEQEGTSSSEAPVTEEAVESPAPSPPPTTSTEGAPVMPDILETNKGEENEASGGAMIELMKEASTPTPEAASGSGLSGGSMMSELTMGRPASINDDDSAADLVAAATEASRVVLPTTVALPSSTTTRAPPPVKAPIRMRSKVSPPSTSTTTTTTTTTTTSTTTTTTTTPAPTTTSEAPAPTTVQAQAAAGEEQPTSSTVPPAPASEDTITVDVDPVSETSAPVAMDDSAPPTTSTTSTTTPAPTTPDTPTTTAETATSARDEPEAEQQLEGQNRKRSARLMGSASNESRSQTMPMLLNNELIEKLMRNKTLVNLMSGQLKRVIDTERMSDTDKERLVRQVFDQMMEEKVDFSMNNVRLAVKTVSSSYRAAAAKQRKRTSSSASVPEPERAGSEPEAAKSGSAKRTRKMDTKGFGWRAKNGSMLSSGGQQTEQQAPEKKTSKSFPVIETALKLTKSTRSSSASSVSSDRSQTGGGTTTSSSSSSSPAPTKQLDSSGNPIVVVLLPQEKAARRR